MESIISTNNLYNGGFSETIFKNPTTKLNYTELVKEIAEETESYWLLDVIASYQFQLKNEEFQVWKLERKITYTEVNDIKIISERTSTFIVTCEDGNNNILVKQKIVYSDFPHDEYVLWYTNNTLLLPSEN
ncbi:MAG: hypothetical protein HC854_15590 [Flavobacterium sp.]|nr:hypothetical protein [Flavobacterium sp.]